MTKISKKPKLPFNSATIEYHNNITCFDISKMVLHLEPEQKKEYIKGSILAERLKKTALNASALDYLLKNPDKIPESWKEKTKDGYTQYIYFWGTIFRRSDGNLYVRCLSFGDGVWQSFCVWLDGVWSGANPAALSQELNSEILSPEQNLDTLPLELFINGIKYKQCDD